MIQRATTSRSLSRNALSSGSSTFVRSSSSINLSAVRRSIAPRSTSRSTAPKYTVTTDGAAKQSVSISNLPDTFPAPPESGSSGHVRPLPRRGRDLFRCRDDGVIRARFMGFRPRPHCRPSQRPTQSPRFQDDGVGGVFDGFHCVFLTKKAPARDFLKSADECLSPCKQHGANDGFFFKQTIRVSAQRGR